MLLKTSLTIMLVIISLSISKVEAKSDFESPDARFLIEACQSVTRIFNAHNEKRLLASQRTSLSDAIRAGYCLGMLEQFQCRFSGKHSLYEGARRIAILNSDAENMQRLSLQRVVETSICY